MELDKRNPTDEEILQLLEFLHQGNFHPAVGISPRGYLDVRVTVPASGIVQAVMATVATVQQDAGATAICVDAMTEAEFDAREGFVHIPEMLSVSQVAALLDVKRQRVLQMIAERKLPSARQVGSTWIIAESDALAKVPTANRRPDESDDEYLLRVLASEPMAPVNA